MYREFAGICVRIEMVHLGVSIGSLSGLHDSSLVLGVILGRVVQGRVIFQPLE